MSTGEVHTAVYPVTDQGAQAALQQAAQVLRRGGLVAFPTETVYGLGADGTDPEAVARIYRAKGRPSDNPLIVHIADPADLQPLVTEIPPLAKLLMERFWPGPLTLVLPRSPLIPDATAGGLPTVGVRMPNHPVARELIRLAGVPVAAPSANISGKPSPTDALHVLEDLKDRVEIILDGGETGVGLESTVLDLTTQPPTLLRPGGVTIDQLEEVCGRIAVDPAVNGQAVERPRAPGMKYAHYAPRAALYLVEGDPSEAYSEMRSLIAKLEAEGHRVGVMHTSEARGQFQADVALEVGSRANLREVATTLFSTLRAFDRHEVDVVVAEGVPLDGIGLAVMNRLRKAAAGRILHV